MFNKKSKEDLTAIALYSMAFSKYMEARKFERELIEYLSKNYTFVKGWDAEGTVGDAMYGTESNLRDFLKLLKEKSKRRER